MIFGRAENNSFFTALLASKATSNIPSLQAFALCPHMQRVLETSHQARNNTTQLAVALRREMHMEAKRGLHMPQASPRRNPVATN